MNKKISFIGAGAMAEAIIKGIIKQGIASQNITVSDINIKRLSYLQQELNVNTTENNISCVENADIIVIAVKPQHCKDVLHEIKSNVQPQQLLISIAAGITTTFIEQCLGKSVPIVRVMPNTPALVGSGVSALTKGNWALDSDIELAANIFKSVGRVINLPEKLIDGATGLSGSGPAYVYLMVEALADGGVKAGLPRDIAIELAAATLEGAAKMVLETKEHPAVLKDRVTSPGGTTIEGLEVMEKAGIRGTLIEAVTAAVNKAQKLSGE